VDSECESISQGAKKKLQMCTLLHLVHPILREKKREREVNDTLLASSCSTDNERVSFEKYTPGRI
jgi:hypothetical protein